MEEQHESGFLSHRYFDEVCRHCIDDPALATFVAGRGRIDGTISTTRLDGITASTTSCGIVESYDLLWHFDDPLDNEELQGEFVSAFEHQWCLRDPYGLEHAQKLLHSWNRFVQTVNSDKRYLLHLGQPEPSVEFVELLNPADVLEAIGAAIVEAGSRVMRSTGNVRLVRARADSPSEEPQSAKKLGSPPSHQAQHNLMSGAGISMFYGAETPTTAIAEIRCDPGHATTVGTWTPSRELTYKDLPVPVTIPSIFDAAARDQRTPLRFLASFAEDRRQTNQRERDDNRIHSDSNRHRVHTKPLPYTG